jgi:hypothetical protein
MTRTVIGGRPMNVDVAIQDQETPAVNYFLTLPLETLTLAAPTIVDGPDITLEAGHSVAVGNIINIREGAFISQAEVVAVNVNAITLNQPLAHIFTVAAVINRATKNLAVDGSVTAQTFFIIPPPLVRWHLVGFSVHITDNLELDDTKFGGIAALASGVLMRVNVGGMYFNLGSAKTNGDLFLLLSSGQYSDKAGAGAFGGFWTGLIRDRLGIVVHLNGADEDTMEVLVQDDIDALVSFEVVAQGHVVLE